MCQPDSETVDVYGSGESLDDHSPDNVDQPAPFHDGGVQESYGDIKNRGFDLAHGPTRLIFLPSKFITFNGRCYLNIVGLMAIFLITGSNSAFIEAPVNEVALQLKQRQAVEMKCKSDCQCDLKWFVNKHDSVKETLYDGYIFRSRAKSYCTVLKDEPGKCQLHVDLTNTADAAQTYTCLEPGTLNETSADLVFVGVQICHENSTEDLVNLTCSIEFRGNWPPAMEWKEHSSYGWKVLSVGVNSVVIQNQRVTSTLVMPIQDGTRNYTCTAKFDIRDKPLSTTARNVPDWNEVWSSPEFIHEDKITTDSGVEVKTMDWGIGIGVGVGILFFIAMVSGFVIYRSVIQKAMFRKKAEYSRSDNAKQRTLLKIKEAGVGAVTPPQLQLGQSQA